MEQQLRRPCLVIPLLVFLPALLSCVHGVDVPAHGKDDIGTNPTHPSADRWSVTVKKGGHGGHGHGHGHGHGNGNGNGPGLEKPPVFNPRTIAGINNNHHRRNDAPGSEIGRPSTAVATCCVVLLAAAIPLLHL